MKKNFLALGTCAFALALGLVACDDSTSANGSSGDENPAEVSSSSILTTSSPTEDPGSSSSNVIASEAKQSSSSVVSSSSETSSSSVESSSSVVSSSVKSSSSVASSSSAKSSSSSGVSSSSSSSNQIENPSCSSKANWAYLNPNKTYGTMTDSRDGQVYKTIEICDKDNKNCQTWMAQNLNYAYTGVPFDDGYDNISDSTSWCYDNKASNCATYGRLYTWAAAVDSVAIYKNYSEECGYGKYCTRFSATALATSPVRGVCPSGWHLPSNAEWGALYTNVGGTSYAGQKLKANSSLWSSNTGTDEYGFSVLPAGSRDYHGNFSIQGNNAYFWSSSEDEYSSGRAWRQYFGCYYDGVSQYSDYENYGFSVRCLKD